MRALWLSIMKNEMAIFKSLLLLAFVFQLLIDVGGFFGWYYNQFPKAAFEFSGYDALLPFSISFPAYLLFTLIYYISIILMFMQSKLAQHFIIAGLAISFTTGFLSGIYVGTPHELFLSWVSWSTYIAACTMFFTSIRYQNG